MPDIVKYNSITSTNIQENDQSFADFFKVFLNLVNFL